MRLGQRRRDEREGEPPVRLGRLRALLAHLTRPAPGGATGPPTPPPPTDAGDEPLPSGFDTFEEVEVSEPSTPVGRVRLAKARADVVKPGTPRPELLERLGIPSGPNAAAPGRGACDRSVRASPRPAPVSLPLPLPPETPPPTPAPAVRRRAPVVLAATGSFLAATVLAVVLFPATPEADTRRAEKLRALEEGCAEKASCAGELVTAFHDQDVDDARRFWREVDACLERCRR